MSKVKIYCTSTGALEFGPDRYQGIFPTQGSNPGLLHCRQTLYLLSHQEVQDHSGMT